MHNSANIHELFSTKIYKNSYSGDLKNLQKSILPKLDDIFEMSKKNNQASMRNGSICSVNVCNNLQDHIDLGDLLDFIKLSLKEYWENLNYIDADLKVYHVWANLYPPGSFIEKHNHSPAPLTASFYLKKPKDSGNIIFENPISTLLRYQPFKGLSDKDNYDVAFDSLLEVKEGDVVIFPGWLIHKTEKNNSLDDRIIIGFDLSYQRK
jgi:uncharacterized protein (TIGR02466 family)